LTFGLCDSLKFQDQLDLPQKPTPASVTDLEKRIHDLTESINVKNVAEELKVEGGTGYWDDTKSVARGIKAGVSYGHTYLPHS